MRVRTASRPGAASRPGTAGPSPASRVAGAVAAIVALCLVVSGCTSSEPRDDASATAPITSPSGDATGTLRVWLMEGSQPGSVIDAVNAAFGKAYPKVEVEVELQQWEGIQGRLDEALAGAEPPDVVQLGSSVTARYADEGLLARLDPADFRVADMLPGMQASGELDGARYGIPYQGGVKVVVYRKSHFAKAKVTVPRTWSRLNRVAARLKATNAGNEDYSALRLPGRDWQSALPFIWGSGGDIAIQEGGQWASTLDSAESRSGIGVLQRLAERYSTAPSDADATDNAKAFRAGNVGMMLDWWWVPGTLDAGDLKGDVGAFALPGRTRGTAPVLMTGSDVAVASGSDQKGLAVEWLKVLTGTKVQTQLARSAGVIPNREAAFAGHENNAFLIAADRAARNARFTPVTPRWGGVESSGVLADMVEAILSGSTTIDQATSDAAQEVTRQLNE